MLLGSVVELKLQKIVPFLEIVNSAIVFILCRIVFIADAIALTQRDQ